MAIDYSKLSHEDLTAIHEFAVKNQDVLQGMDANQFEKLLFGPSGSPSHAIDSTQAKAVKGAVAGAATGAATGGIVLGVITGGLAAAGGAVVGAAVGEVVGGAIGSLFGRKTSQFNVQAATQRIDRLRQQARATQEKAISTGISLQNGVNIIDALGQAQQ